MDPHVRPAPRAEPRLEQLAVLKLLRDPYFRMKQWAADAAVKLKITEALPILDDLAANAIGPGVTKAMKSAAEKLRKAAEPADADDE